MEIWDLRVSPGANQRGAAKFYALSWRPQFRSAPRPGATHERVEDAARALPRPAQELAAEAAIRERQSARSGEGGARTSAAQPRLVWQSWRRAFLASGLSRVPRSHRSSLSSTRVARK
jgi:hypothetical protein